MTLLADKVHTRTTNVYKWLYFTKPLSLHKQWHMAVAWLLILLLLMECQLLTHISHFSLLTSLRYFPFLPNYWCGNVCTRNNIVHVRNRLRSSNNIVPLLNDEFVGETGRDNEENAHASYHDIFLFKVFHGSQGFENLGLTKM